MIIKGINIYIFLYNVSYIRFIKMMLILYELFNAYNEAYEITRLL
jgi:hypothetical protein